MHIEDIAQFKFSSGQEIVCEVMEWPDDGEKDIIVRNAMAIVMGETSDGDRIYMFKPWVHFFGKNDEYICVNSFHIVSQNRPNENLIKEYIYAIKEMHEQARERDEDYLNDEREKLKKLQGALNLFTKTTIQHDSAESNVVRFPRKDDTVH
jgi:hypothetical protein